MSSSKEVLPLVCPRSTSQPQHCNKCTENIQFCGTNADRVHWKDPTLPPTTYTKTSTVQNTNLTRFLYCFCSQWRHNIGKSGQHKILHISSLDVLHKQVFSGSVWQLQRSLAGPLLSVSHGPLFACRVWTLTCELILLDWKSQLFTAKLTQQLFSNNNQDDQRALFDDCKVGKSNVNFHNSRQTKGV